MFTKIREVGLLEQPAAPSDFLKYTVFGEPPTTQLIVIAFSYSTRPPIINGLAFAAFLLLYYLLCEFNLSFLATAELAIGRGSLFRSNRSASSPVALETPHTDPCPLSYLRYDTCPRQWCRLHVLPSVRECESRCCIQAASCVSCLSRRYSTIA